MSDLNWLVTSIVKSCCFIYHATFFAVRSNNDSTEFEKWSFLALWLLLHIIYMWLAYSFDYSKKLNYAYVSTLKTVSNLFSIAEGVPPILQIRNWVVHM